MVLKTLSCNSPAPGSLNDYLIKLSSFVWSDEIGLQRGHQATDTDELTNARELCAFQSKLLKILRLNKMYQYPYKQKLIHTGIYLFKFVWGERIFFS